MVVLALTASGVLFYLADGNLDLGQYKNVMRNWEQYGLFTLKGKLVTNAGGFEALAKPEVYPGHHEDSRTLYLIDGTPFDKVTP